MRTLANQEKFITQCDSVFHFFCIGSKYVRLKSKVSRSRRSTDGHTDRQMHATERIVALRSRTVINKLGHLRFSHYPFLIYIPEQSEVNQNMHRSLAKHNPLPSAAITRTSTQ